MKPKQISAQCLRLGYLLKTSTYHTPTMEMTSYMRTMLKINPLQLVQSTMCVAYSQIFFKPSFTLLGAFLIAQLVKNLPAMQEIPFDSWVGKLPGKGIGYPLQCSWVSLVAQTVKNPPAMLEAWVLSLGWEEPLENGKASDSSILAWKIPRTVQSIGVAKSGTRLSDCPFHFTLLK